MVFEEEYLYNFYRCNDCKAKIKTRVDWFDFQGCPKCHSSNIKVLQERFSLFDAEMAMESNRDFGAFFLRYGDKVDKFSIERRLSSLKKYVFQSIRQRSESRRFKRFR